MTKHEIKVLQPMKNHFSSQKSVNKSWREKIAKELRMEWAALSTSTQGLRNLKAVCSNPKFFLKKQKWFYFCTGD